MPLAADIEAAIATATRAVIILWSKINLDGPAVCCQIAVKEKGGAIKEKEQVIFLLLAQG